MQTNVQTVIFKVCLSGSSSAGKTSFMLRLLDNTFGENIYGTIGCDFRIKLYPVTQNIQPKLQLWDPTGSQRYNYLSKSFYRNACAVLHCFDLSNRSNFKRNIQQLQKIMSNQISNQKIYLIGCKSDLINTNQNQQQQIPLSQILQICEKYRIKYFQTSSKLGYNVRQCFQIIMKQCVNRYLIKPSAIQNGKIAPISNLKPESKSFCFY